MVVFKRIPLLFLLKLNSRSLIYIISLSLVTYWLSEVLHISNPTVLLPSMAVFGTVLSIVLAFRTNEAYNRWWEARILWGAFVNSSRSFGREILAYLNTTNTELSEEDIVKEQKTFVYRHIAYINSVRLHLRQQKNFNEELKPFLSDPELIKISDYKNIPTQINVNQSRRLKDIYRPDKLNGFEYVQLNNTLNALFDIQGSCERIKFTIFPRLYTYYTTSFTWIFSTILILSLIDEFDWQTLLIRALVSYVFITVNQLGSQLKNPFENQISDTPMTALSRTIEIDLRQMLGETDLPEPIQSKNGILM